MNLLLTPLSLLPALFVWRWPTPTEWALGLFIGLCAALAHNAFTRAFARADASAVMPFDYMRLPFVAVVGYLLFAEVPDGWTWVGAAVIAAAAIYIAQRSEEHTSELQSPIRHSSALLCLTKKTTTHYITNQNET